MTITKHKAMIFDIQKFSIHDGPGIRTLLFFKGCPLRCLWCSNPEGLTSTPSFFRDQKLCIHCGQCEHHCPSGALRVIGQEMSVSEVMKILMSDFIFYRESGGGITLGGGEPTMHSEFCLELLRQCRGQGTHTAIESCLYAPWKTIEQLLPWLDLWMIDLKVMDDKIHQMATGVSNTLILENMKKLFLAANVPLLLRLPVIPGINDHLENFQQIIAFIKEHDPLGRVTAVELLPYHRYGVRKYQGLQMEYRYSEAATKDDQYLQYLNEIVQLFSTQHNINCNLGEQL
ncbi:MAG: glycyl-radical enzyme activating protein [Oligoflexia bacterium]|nr:glycyl-radical enzyme activating protein [Oligoflexia bacterium]MBF0366449.1 glycyl-radical enzyme activating protein [Oligoflexia bacterium]